MRKIKAKGFTLIELMTVVGIIAILAAIAIPGYDSYISEAKRSEMFVQIRPAIDAVNAYYAETGRFPKDNAEAGLPDADAMSGKFVRSIAIENGVISATYELKEELETTVFHPAINPAFPQQVPVWGVREQLAKSKLKVIGLAQEVEDGK